MTPLPLPVPRPPDDRAGPDGASPGDVSGRDRADHGDHEEHRGPQQHREHEAPVISLVVPVYNAAGHLPHVLEVLAREARPEVEVIIVDDASTDATPNLLQAFCAAQKPGSVQVVTLAENGGAGVARRAGLTPARGRYLMWLDVDDEPVPGALDLALTAIASSKPGTVLVFDYRITWRDGRSTDMPGMTSDRVDGLESAVSSLLRRAISPYMWNKLVPRDGLQPEHFATRRNGQDWLTLVNILAVHPRVQRVPTVLVDYVQQAGTLSRSIDLVGYSSSDGGLVAEMRDLLRQRGLWAACQRDFLLWYVPRISANTAISSARRDEPGPSDTLPQVAANVRGELPVRQLLRGLGRGDRAASGALCLLRLSPRLFRRVSRRADPA